MINRTLVRTRVIQNLYAYYKDGDCTPLTAKKQLLKSFSDTYSLYFLLLSLVDEVTRYAEEQMNEAAARAKATHTSYEPNKRFIHNKFAMQLFNNHTLRSYTADKLLSWDAGHNAVIAVYKELIVSPFYEEYMALPSASYEDDKRLWRRIFQRIVAESEQVESALEELEVVHNAQNWSTDMQIVVSYVIKTIKQFDEAKMDDMPLLEMFDTEDELTFAKDLLRLSIEHHDEYMDLIHTHLKNWDAERIAYMDGIIMQVALTEILNFPEIPLEISMNEYIELSKEYSSDKSYMFINGILNNILHEKKESNSLFKTVR